jgi:hypothetical protein
MTLFGGFPYQGAYGGAVATYPGTVTTISACTIAGNRAASGGGIWNQGTMTIASSTISGNAAMTNGFVSGDALGGGIWNTGALTITGSKILNNQALSSSGHIAAGAGIYSDTAAGAALVIRASTIAGNVATSTDGEVYGGGIAAGGTSIKITDSKITQNTAVSSYFNFSTGKVVQGGGLFFGPDSTALVGTTAITGNVAAAMESGHTAGGGVAVDTGCTVTLKGSVVSGNRSAYQGGGIYRPAPENIVVTGGTVVKGNLPANE